MEDQNEIKYLSKELSKTNREYFEARAKISALYRNIFLLLLFLLVLIVNYFNSVKDYKNQIETLKQENASLSVYYEGRYSEQIYWTGYNDGHEDGFSEGEEHMIEYYSDYIGTDEFFNDYGIEIPQ